MYAYNVLNTLWLVISITVYGAAHLKESVGVFYADVAWPVFRQTARCRWPLFFTKTYEEAW
jgi:hypothetical protein